MESPSPGVVLLIVLVALALVLLGVAVFLLVKLLRMFSLVRRDDMPVKGKVAFWAAVIYTVFPVDLLVDPIYLDDIGVLAGALAYLTHLVGKYGLDRDEDEDGDGDEPVEIDRASTTP